MSVVNIPELADSIASNLSLHDLTICIRINKAWNATFVPHLWRTTPPPDVLRASWTPPLRHDFFRLAVRFDYLAAKQQQQQQQEQRGQDLSSSFLSRYGPWIRHLTLNQVHLEDQSKYFRSASFFPPPPPTETITTSATVKTDPDLPSTPEPTEQDLMLHLLKHCPNLQSLNLDGWIGIDANLDFWRTIAREVVPNLVELSVKFKDHGRGSYLPFAGVSTVSIPPILIAGCRGGKLGKLIIPGSNKLWTEEEVQTEVQRRAQDQQGLPQAQVQVQVQEAAHLQESLGQDGSSGSLVKMEKEELLDQVVDMDQSLAGLKELEMSGFADDPDGSRWERFLKRCIHLETLHVNDLGASWSQALRGCTSLRRLDIDWATAPSLRLLTDVLLTGGLPNLDDISVNYQTWVDDNVMVDHVVALLEAGQKGWRNISLPVLETRTLEVLIRHCATIEFIKAEYTHELTSAHMRQILASSPRLHTLFTLVNGEYVGDSIVSHILSEDFIDLDPETDTLRPWACEGSLKVFSAKILGIPRPDVTLTHYGLPFAEIPGNTQAPQEAHSGQSRELQARIYERLSRFTQLECLELGHDDRDFGSEGDFVENAQGDFVLGDRDYQYECLSMSLQSGVCALEGLKKLKVLSVFRMATSIGVKEVEWMVQTWPRLETLVGLNIETEAGMEAHQWVIENCKRVHSWPYTSEP